jgi:1A family penicillin-binding protein
MDAILIKILASALALSQAMTGQQATRTEFDTRRDRGEVTQLLRDGCKQAKRAFDIEDVNLDELIDTALSDPATLTSDNRAFRGINFADLNKLYREFCSTQSAAESATDLGPVIEYYNKALADLPDHTKLKGMTLPGRSVILDKNGEKLAEIYEPGQRRIWLPISQIPLQVQKAFISAEDRRFFEHKGIDPRAIVRAFASNLAGKREGGSTITQQVVKNLLVGDDATYDRKIREMIVASRLERIVSKQDILELYLNAIYLGRGSWGVEMAANAYFGKPVNALTLAETALLAGLTKGPNYYDPDKHPDRAQERLAYVLGRMQEDGVITSDQMAEAVKQKPNVIAIATSRTESALHAIDYVGRELKTLQAGGRLPGGSYSVRSTIDRELQRAAEAALQEGLARYEEAAGRVLFSGAEANIGDAIRKYQSEPPGGTAEIAWRQALEAVRLPLHDVHWMTAVVVDITAGKNAAPVVRVGLHDGRVLPLSGPRSVALSKLKLYDVIYVRVLEAKGRAAVRAELRVRPAVQGAALVLENSTGRILAMTGSFSYQLSQLDRATQTRRQPGSTFKPLSYLAALSSGLQPNTLIWDAPVTLPALGNKAGGNFAEAWTPSNYDRNSSGVVTLRRALENSKNQVTARLLNAIGADAEDSLSRICGLALEAQLYKACEPYYPFVLGSQPVRLLDLVAFYAAIANEGARPNPYAIEAIDDAGRIVHQAHPSFTWIGSADRIAFYQLKSLLQGVLQRGTAQSIRYLAPYVAGKTGTSDEENDAWFIGLTNEATVGVWVGYDNSDGQRRTLGPGQTGAKVAVPIFEQLVNAFWRHTPRTALSPPSAEVQRKLMMLPVDVTTGEPGRSGREILEYLRTDDAGRPIDTQYRLVSRDAVFASGALDPWIDGDSLRRFDRQGAYAQGPFWRSPPEPPVMWRPYSQQPWWDYQEYRRRERRVDPDYPWHWGRLF